MPELGTYGSVRGAAGNSRPYRERRPPESVAPPCAAGIRNPSHEQPPDNMVAAAGSPQKAAVVGLGAARRDSTMSPVGHRVSGHQRRALGDLMSSSPKK
jgi:hypothetical protein